MKKKIILGLMVTVFLCAVTAGAAEAGWFGKSDKKDREENRAKTHRFDYYPSMSFHIGTLRRDNFSGWRLDEKPLKMVSGAQVTSGGMDIRNLREGEKALVMGAKVGDTIVGWRVRILEADWNVNRDTSRDHEITWSESDPTVGEGPIGK